MEVGKRFKYFTQEIGTKGRGKKKRENRVKLRCDRKGKRKGGKQRGKRNRGKEKEKKIEGIFVNM